MIRHADVNDAEGISGLYEMSFRQQNSRQNFQRELSANESAYWLVAEYAGRIVGYLGGNILFSDDRTHSIMHLSSLAVDPEFQNLGIAAILLHTMGAQCDGIGVESMVLEVRTSNRKAIFLYEECGFETADIREAYYDDNGEDALVMVKLLF